MAEMGTRSDHVQLQILVRRLEALRSNASFAVLSGLVAIAILSFAFFHPAWLAPIAVWAFTATAVLLSRLLIINRIDFASRDYSYLRGAFRGVSASLIAMSGVWSLGIALFGMIADGFEITILAGIGIALFVGVHMMHRTTPVAALAHVVLLGLGMFAASWFVLDRPSGLIAALLAFYAAVLWIALRRQEQAFVRAVVIEEQEREAAATVAMLLNDYEQQSSDWLWTVDGGGRLRDVSPRFAEAAGRDRGELEGSILLDLFLPNDARNRLARHILECTAFRELLLTLQVNGETRHWSLSARQRPDGRMSGVSRDVTADKLIEERVAFMAHFDNLTGLANRYLFNERLRKVLSGGAGSNVALFYLDLDDFKAVNDTRGHMIGDRLLREVAWRLEQEVRAEDLVARLGGDEFAVLIETKAGAGMLIERAHRFLSSVREPYEIDGQTYRVSTSVGVARCVDGDCEAEELMRRADLALFAAKAKGRDNLAIFDHELDRAAKERREIESDLRDAIARDELRLHYQPVIELETGRTTGYEALLRWYHPRRGLMAPNEFLHIAEGNGMIVPMGEWVIRQAIAETASWPGHIRIAINLSPTQVRSPQLVAVVAQAININGIAPQRIEFEITEHVLLHENEASRATLHKLRELGAKIALDDFGTGYSSLAYLRRFPFDRIKIDRNFVEGIESSVDNQVIVSAITRMADALGMSTTAEGVEYRSQLDILRKLGCNEAQGFFICEPVPGDRLLAAGGSRTDLVDLGNDVLDYRKARERALRRGGSRVA